MNIFLFLGALNGFLSVGLGAFGAHILDGNIEPKYIDTWQTAVQYQMFHAVGLLVIGVLKNLLPNSTLLKWSGWFMFIGIIIFSGSLFVLSTTGIRILGAITPIGGFSFLTGWILLMVSATKEFNKGHN